MEELLHSLIQIFYWLWIFLVNLGGALLPWTPLAAWVAFWLFAVNWAKLWPVLRDSLFIPVVLVGVVMVLVWGTASPPADGYHHMLGLTLSNFVGKTVYVAGLLTIMFLCGAVQLTGCCAEWTRFEDEPAELQAHEPAH